MALFPALVLLLWRVPLGLLSLALALALALMLPLALVLALALERDEGEARLEGGEDPAARAWERVVASSPPPTRFGGLGWNEGARPPRALPAALGRPAASGVMDKSGLCTTG